MFFQSVPCNQEAIDVKRIMHRALADARRLYGVQKKEVAFCIGVNVAVLSRWLKEDEGHTISAHLIRPFCEVTRDWSLARYFQPKRRSA